MKVVVGLGNPGKRYDGTPHNVGFDTVSELARREQCALRRSMRFKARIGKAGAGDDMRLLVQPLTYMNRSGLAVSGILRYRKIDASGLLVVLDDADLDIGRLRIRPRGSAGGHRGLASIMEYLGTEEFARVRIGIGRGEAGSDLVEHVLRRSSKEERERLEKVVAAAADAVLCVFNRGVEDAMNRFNGREY